MFNSIRNAFAGFVFTLVIAGSGGAAHAISNPSAILWATTDPRAFITSVYLGVLGRPPENSKVITDWARQITPDVRSKLSVFRQFLGSPEYHSRFPGGVGGPYTVWQNNTPHARNDRFRVATRMPPGSWTPRDSGISLEFGTAMVGYYMVAIPYVPVIAKPKPAPKPTDPVWVLYGSAQLPSSIAGKSPAEIAETVSPCDIVYTVGLPEDPSIKGNVAVGTMVEIPPYVGVTWNEAQRGLRAYSKYYDDGVDGVVKFVPCRGTERPPEPPGGGGGGPPGGGDGGGPPSGGNGCGQLYNWWRANQCDALIDTGALHLPENQHAIHDACFNRLVERTRCMNAGAWPPH